MPIVWSVLGVVIVVSGVKAGRSDRALRVGRLAVGVLYVGAGALVNAAYLIQGEDYADFAEGSYITFVRDTWSSLVVPNHDLFIGALVAFEAAVGVLVVRGGRSTVVALTAAIGFHVALLSFGWWFYLWSLPVGAALVSLLRAHLRTERQVVGRVSTGHASYATVGSSGRHW